MNKQEYSMHVAALVVAQLAAKSAAGSDFSSDLSFWDEPSDLAKMAFQIAKAMRDEAYQNGLLHDCP